MTDKATLLALADKLEMATEPSRELDARIACAERGLEFFIHPGFGGTLAGRNPDNRDEVLFLEGDDVPKFTASIDAALTLVPEGWLWTAARQYGHDGKPPYFGDCASAAWIEQVEGCREQGEAFAASAPLALCAAALRARAA